MEDLKEASAALDLFFQHNIITTKEGETYKVHLSSQLESFLIYNKGKRIVFVTSGGTAVPLEQNAVRFLTNFSIGRRGSAMTERFLELGYSVVFATKDDARQPFCPQDCENLEDLMGQLGEKGEVSQGGIGGDGGHMVLHRVDDLIACIHLKRQSKCEGRFLKLEFRTVAQYLLLLKIVCESLAQHKVERPMIVLAAAVSDYYLPLEKMASHKISGGDGLDIHLESVPKTLGILKGAWLNGCLNPFIVTFKLETDADVLVEKARKNITLYGLEIVVANLLQNYRTEALMVRAGGKGAGNDTVVIDKVWDRGRSIDKKLCDILVDMW